MDISQNLNLVSQLSKPSTYCHDVVVITGVFVKTIHHQQQSSIPEPFMCSKAMLRLYP